KKRGYIEQFFGSAHWKRCLKAGANNYTGNNITARTRGVNMEVLASNKQAYPTVAAGMQQIEDFFARLRQLPDSSGISKQQQWLDAWQNMPDVKKRRITDEQYLLLFGIEKKEKVRISNVGIRTQINGEEYYYAVPHDDFLQAVGSEVTLKYDPADLSRVLVIGKGIRFVAPQAKRVAKAVVDYQAGERAYLNALLQEKRKQVDYVNTLAMKRQRILAESGIEPDALLNSGLLVKEIKQDAETHYLNQLAGLTGNDAHEEDLLDPLEQM
ncbi:MAG: Mu transposase C-terminal domain-containing protein, partial [Acidobacterium ailaaui]|nr:Mu transposase C-terminal domain-containing protein [Pseudacidobacterium ailaaui]